MEVIDFNEKIYKEKIKFKGYEANIYEIDNLLYKIFKTNNKDILINKEVKLELLGALNLITSPLALIYDNGVVKGYVMNDMTKLGYKTLNNLTFSKKNKKEIFENIKNKIEELHKFDIILGDINDNNILVKENDVCFCDLDNSKVFNFDFDTLSHNEDYYLNHLDGDEYLDYYMYNLLMICHLGHIHPPAVIDFYVSKGYLPRAIKTKENVEILEAMFHFDKQKIKYFNYKKRY